MPSASPAAMLFARTLLLLWGFVSFGCSPGQGLRITTSSLPAGSPNSAYTATVKAAGGAPPYAWSATGLPARLSINSASGGISGTPASAGQSSVLVQVSDSGTPRQSTSINLALVVSSANISRGILGIISQDSSGTPSTGISQVIGPQDAVVLSSTGRYAAFATRPANLISPAVQQSDVYWHDACLGAPNCTPSTVLVSAVSPAPGGNSAQEGNGPSSQPTISADGRLVGFVSSATNLDQHKPFTIKYGQIYLRDLCTGVMTGCTPLTDLANETDLATEPNRPSIPGTDREYDMSADGLHIAFTTNATNVMQSVAVPGLTYLEDTDCTALLNNAICSPKLNLASMDSSGRPDQNLAAIGPVLGMHGLLLASSRFAQITPVLTSEQLFVQGTCIHGVDNQACVGAGTPAMMDVSVDNSGRPGPSGVSHPFSISSNGRFVVFASPDALAPNSGQFSIGRDNIFVRDTCQAEALDHVDKLCGTPSTTTVSVADNLAPANDLNFISSHAISADGRLVIFSSRATNLAQGGPSGNGEQGVFIRDTCRNAPASCTPSTVLVSMDAGGAFVPAGANGDSDAVISADGHSCAFSAFLSLNGKLTQQFVLALTGF